MAEAVKLQAHQPLIVEDEDDFISGTRGPYARRSALPPGVETLELRGPFFFGVANLLVDVMGRIGNFPRAFILVLRDVPLVDATGGGALKDFAAHCRRHRTMLVLCELQPAARATLTKMGVIPQENVHLAASYEEALTLSRPGTVVP
jgi:sulfate permease, SulP family